MKKYKLIKEYPGSPKKDFILDKTWIINYPLNCYLINGLTFNPDNHEEFWEEVIEKDYEILSFISTNTTIGEKAGVIRIPKYEGYNVDDYLYNGESVKNGAYLIHSVKRLSDGEIFTIGDETNSGIIESFKQFENRIIVNFDCTNLPNLPMYLDASGKLLTKVKKPLFTTEDGVDIFESDKFWFVNNIKNGLYLLNEAVAKQNHYNSKSTEGIFDFSTKEKAEEYILMNKKSLSINDILKVWSKLSGHTTNSLLKNSKLMHRIIISIK